MYSILFVSFPYQQEREFGSMTLKILLRRNVKKKRAWETRSMRNMTPMLMRNMNHMDMENTDMMLIMAKHKCFTI